VAHCQEIKNIKGIFMEFLFKEKISKLIHQGVTWQSNLVEELVKMKQVYGAEGVKKRLVEELAKTNSIGSLPKGSYLMRLVSLVEKLQKKNISRRNYEQLPLPYYEKIIKFVTSDNIHTYIDYLRNEGQLKILENKLKQGYKLEYNIFAGEYEFVNMDENHENI
jgi:hypothetical protein